MSIRSSTTNTDSVNAFSNARPIGSGDVLAGRFVVEVLLGEGAFAWIFSALDLSRAPPCRVALKLYRKGVNEAHDHSASTHELDCLLRVHMNGDAPNVVQPIAPTLSYHRDIPYLVIELISGCSLRHWMERNRRVCSTESMMVATGIARGLHALHSAGVVHCDIKPTNVFLREDGTPVLLDLGIARFKTEQASPPSNNQRPWMTPRSASPEQLAAEDIGPASDIYSFGLVLHEIFTGELPQCATKLTTSIPSAVRWTIERCLHIDPARRPTAKDVLDCLCQASVDQRIGWRKAWLIACTVIVVMGLTMIRGVGMRAIAPPSETVQCRKVAIDPKKATNRWEHDWSRSFGSGSTLRLCGSEIDASGNTWIGGMFFGSLDLGTTRLDSHGSADVFLLKFDAHGEVTWADRFGDDDWQSCTGLAMDATGNIFISGGMLGTAEFGAEHVDANSEAAIFVAKIRTDGRVLWAKGFRTSNPQAGGKLAADSQGAVVISGEFRETVHLGPVPLVSAGNADLFLAKLDTDGHVMWAREFGGRKSERLNSIAIGANDNIAMTARFGERIRVGEEALESGEGTGHFVAVFDASGTNRFAVHLGNETTTEQSGSWVHMDGGGITVVGRAVEMNPKWVHERMEPNTTTWIVAFNEEGQQQRCRYLPGYLRTKSAKSGNFTLLQGDAAPNDASPLFLTIFDVHDNVLNSDRIGHATKLPHVYYHAITANEVIMAGAFEGHLDLGMELDSVGFRSIFATRLRLKHGAP